MAFIKNLIASILIISSLGVSAKIVLPRLDTKLAPDSIRFISNDGRHTYQMKRSGALMYSSNFKAKDVLTVEAGSDFQIKSSYDRNNITLEVIPAPHTYLDLNKNHDIYIIPYGGTTATKLGQGRSPRLHLDDAWITWYNPKTKEITIRLIKDEKRQLKIKLTTKHNPYFLPDVVMLNTETLLYTDINDKGQAALLAYNTVRGQTQVIFKSGFTATKLELCSGEDYIALGEFGYDDTGRGSSIMSLPFKTAATNLTGFQTIYRSSDSDIGNLTCTPKSVWFVKTVAEDRKLNIKTTEAAELDMSTHKISIRSDLEKVAQIIDVDGRLIIPLREDIYVLTGEANLSSDKLQKVNRRAP